MYLCVTVLLYLHRERRGGEAEEKPVNGDLLEFLASQAWM